MLINKTFISFCILVYLCCLNLIYNQVYSLYYKFTMTYCTFVAPLTEYFTSVHGM